jgi:hypothetical protein
MYTTRPGLILGFHGCDKEVRDKALNLQQELKPSKNIYDWLGSGIYFWEASPTRALDFITDLKANPRPGKPIIKEPTVLGAVIDLRYCFDLIEYKNLEILKEGYKSLRDIFKSSGLDLPQNRNIKGNNDLLLRELDCLVIESIHHATPSDRQFDSVRGVFLEGDELYPNAGFREKNHIQICIRNPNCIKGYFLPRKLT